MYLAQNSGIRVKEHRYEKTLYFLLYSVYGLDRVCAVL